MTYCSKCNIRENYVQENRRYTKCDNCGSAVEYICGKCEKLYKSYDSVKFHRKVWCEKKASLPCSSCDYIAHRKKDLAYHVVAKHTDPNLLETPNAKTGGKRVPRKCPFCPYVNNPAGLRAHICNTHMHINERD